MSKLEILSVLLFDEQEHLLIGISSRMDCVMTEIHSAVQYYTITHSHQLYNVINTLYTLVKLVLIKEIS